MARKWWRTAEVMSGQDVMKWTSLSFRLVLGLCTAEADMRAQIEASHVPARGAAHGDGNASLHGARVGTTTARHWRELGSQGEHDTLW